MKTINVTFEDAEYRRLVKKKNGVNWHDFVLDYTKPVKKEV